MLLQTWACLLLAFARIVYSQTISFPSTVNYNQSITVSGTGYNAGENLVFTFASYNPRGILIQTPLSANGDGGISFPCIIPNAAPEDVYFASIFRDQSRVAYQQVRLLLSNPVIYIDPSSPQPGSSFAVIVGGASSGKLISVAITSPSGQSNYLSGSANANSNGFATISLNLPADPPYGSYTVTGSYSSSPYVDTNPATTINYSAQKFFVQVPPSGAVVSNFVPSMLYSGAATTQTVTVYGTPQQTYDITLVDSNNNKVGLNTTAAIPDSGTLVVTFNLPSTLNVGTYYFGVNRYSSISTIPFGLTAYDPGAGQPVKLGTYVQWQTNPSDAPTSFILYNPSGRQVDTKSSNAGTDLQYFGIGSNYPGGKWTITSLYNYNSAAKLIGTPFYFFIYSMVVANVNAPTGTTASVAVTGAPPNATITWTFSSASLPSGSGTTDGNGAYTISVAVPYTAQTGFYTLTVASGDNSATSQFGVTGRSFTASLPATLYYGQTYSITGSGAGPNQPYTYTLYNTASDGSRYYIFNAVSGNTASASGAISASVTIPNGVPSGQSVFSVTLSDGSMSTLTFPNIALQNPVITLSSATVIAGSALRYSVSGAIGGSTITITFVLNSVFPPQTVQTLTPTADSTGSIGPTDITLNDFGSYTLTASYFNTAGSAKYSSSKDFTVSPTNTVFLTNFSPEHLYESGADVLATSQSMTAYGPAGSTFDITLTDSNGAPVGPSAEVTIPESGSIVTTVGLPAEITTGLYYFGPQKYASLRTIYYNFTMHTPGPYFTGNTYQVDFVSPQGYPVKYGEYNNSNSGALVGTVQTFTPTGTSSSIQVSFAAGDAGTYTISGIANSQVKSADVTFTVLAATNLQFNNVIAYAGTTVLVPFTGAQPNATVSYTFTPTPDKFVATGSTTADNNGAGSISIILPYDVPTRVAYTLTLDTLGGSLAKSFSINQRSILFQSDTFNYVGQTSSFSIIGAGPSEPFTWSITGPTTLYANQMANADSNGVSIVPYTITAGAPLGDYRMNVTFPEGVAYSNVLNVRLDTPVITVTPASNPLPPGGSVAVTVTGGSAGQTISYVITTPSVTGNVTSGSANAASDGSIGPVDVVIPAGSPPGTYTATASYSDGTTTLSKSATFTVTQAVPTIIIVSDQTPLLVGQTATISVSGATSKQTISYTITAPNGTVAVSDSVAADPNGAIGPLNFSIPPGSAPGDYTVTATIGTLSTSQTLQVGQRNPDITVTPSSVPLTVGQTVSLTVAGGTSGQTISYSIAPPASGTVIQGSALADGTGVINVPRIPITAGSPPGTYIVTATYTTGGIDYTGTTSFVVQQVQQPIIKITPAVNPLTVGGSFDLSVGGATSGETVAYDIIYPSSASLQSDSPLANSTGQISVTDILIPAGSPGGTYTASASYGAFSNSQTFTVNAATPVVTFEPTGSVLAGSTIQFDLSSLVTGQTVNYGVYRQSDNELLTGTDGSTTDPNTSESGISIDIPSTARGGNYYIQAIQPDSNVPSNQEPFVIQALPSAGAGRKRRLRRVRKDVCPVKGETACYTKSGNFECVDLLTDLENCGGCTTEGTAHDAKGVNCLEIDKAIGVKCYNAKCHVSSCEDNWRPSLDSSRCY